MYGIYVFDHETCDKKIRKYITIDLKYENHTTLFSLI